MKTLSKLPICFATLIITCTSVLGNIVWIGSPGGDFFEPTNWDDNIGPDPDSNPETPYLGGDIVFSDSSAVASQKLILGTGLTMTVTNSTLDFTGFGIEGIQNATTDSLFNLDNSTFKTTSIANDAVFSLSANSTLEVLGLNNTVNGNNTPTNNTRVNLGDGSRILHVNGNNGTGGASVGARIFRTTSGTSFEADFSAAPLEEFTLAGDQTPFSSPNDGAFTITARNPSVTAEIIIGFRLTPPEPSQPIWFPTTRTATDWQNGLDAPNIINYGFSGILGVLLGDVNGDGLDDKMIYQASGNNIQIVAAFTSDGDFSNTDFNSPNGDNQFPWWDVVNMVPTFADVDGDGIDDSTATVATTGGNIGDVSYIPGATVDTLYWAASKSEGIPGISTVRANNFTGWNPFGIPSLGDVPLTGDFNGDGIADRMIYRTTSNSAFIDYSDPAGGWGDGAVDVGPIAIGIAGDTLLVSDINGDGLDDLVVARDTSGDTPGLQTLYGFYNDGNEFASLDGAQPDIITNWGVDDGILFGRISLPAASADLSGLQITEVTSAGANLALEGLFHAPLAATYQLEASLTLAEDSWVNVGSIVAAATGSTSFSITDTALDTAFPSTDPRQKVFVRISVTP